LALFIVSCNSGIEKTGDTTSKAEAIYMNPLPSWKEGPNKSAIIDFLNQVIQQDGPSYVRCTLQDEFINPCPKFGTN
jgi:hypothetical protein